jgi:Poly(ADP-ribose) polymerase and DNA-Ligase Zn-finger region
VAHVIEPASSGRAKCRSCDRPIAKGELRLGERQPNAFGDGEMTLWFHLPCGAYSRPEPFLEAQRAAPADAGMDARGRATQGAVAEAQIEPLAAAARFGIEHRRVPRLHGAERATSGRAHCRSCRELIAKGEWRLPLVFFEDYRFSPGGYVHARCARSYFETTELLDRVRHFSPELREAELAEVAAAMTAAGQEAP